MAKMLSVEKLAYDIAMKAFEYEFEGKTLREWIDILKDYQSSKWISVEERLPEGNGPYCQNVIVLTIKKEVMPGFCNHGLWYVMRPEDDYCNDADDGEVTHWMPLPEPPKEGT